MQLLEEYQQLIERDAVEISCLWKYIQMFLYFLCIASGYICSILFYILWQHCFGGDCLLWAKFILMSKMKSELNDIFDIDEIQSNYTDWWKYVIMDYEFLLRCKMYLIICFSSCIFGVTWFTLFLVCGRGGFTTTMYESPWKIILPALLFNFIFSIMSIYANYNLREGFKEFNKEVKIIFFKIYNSSRALKDVSECEIIQTYVTIYNYNNYNVCYILIWLQISSDIMMWSWIGGLAILILRIITVVDFRIFKVTIYKLSYDNILDNDNKSKINKNEEENKKIE